MASIKERAAALNLADKLCVRPAAAAAAASGRPAQSSSTWSSLIARLRSGVTVKRRRLHLKSHADCFLGSEAVDVLAEHVTRVRGLEGAVVSRDKVACVCQALLQCNVFQTVGTKVFGKDKKRDVFQDSKSALYRFVDVCTPSVDELEKGVNGIQKLFCPAPADRQEEPLVQTSTPFRLAQPSVKPCWPETPGVSAGGQSVEPPTDGVLPETLVDEVWQEQTLLRLLNLVELPLLDGVLQCIQNPSSPAQSDPDLICSSSSSGSGSNHLDRQILKAFRDSQEDEWLRAALDCLDFLPDQPVVELSRELPQCSQEPAGGSTQEEGNGSEEDSLAQWKLLLYGALLKHYSDTNRPPLLPQHLSDVYAAVTDLLVNAELKKALEALQLCLKLLPPSSRDELRRLLAFMSLAADPGQTRVDKEVENWLAVRRSFSRAVLHCRALSKENEELLVVFMLSNVQEIFKIPGALHKGVSDKLAGLVQGKQPDVTGSTFCQQVSSRTTNQELWSLLNLIHLDTKNSAKERRRLLGQFYRAHPQIFDQYFGDSAASVL